MRILVTGATGFVGRWAVEGLLRRNCEVVALSRGGQAMPGAVHVYADLCDPADVQRALAVGPIDAVLHCAWSVVPGHFWNAGENLDCIAATMNLMRRASDVGITRFIGVGTCFEYAWPEDGLCDEETTAIEPTTLYAIAKDATRRVLAAWCAERAMSFVWARLFYLYGPNEHPDRLVPSLTRKLIQGVSTPLYNGALVRDFMDVRDAGDALAALAMSRVQGAVNIASGHAAALSEVADCLGRIAGRPDLIVNGIVLQPRNEPQKIAAATGRLRNEVGTIVPRSLGQGLAEAYSWWRAQSGRASSHG